MDGVHSWVHYKNRSELRPSTEANRLRTEKWILNKSGQMVSASEATIQTLSEEYDTTAAASESFIKFLGIRDESLDTAQLSEDQRRKIKLAEKIEQSGLSEEEVDAAILSARRMKEAADDPTESDRGNHPETHRAERPVFGLSLIHI